MSPAAGGRSGPLPPRRGTDLAARVLAGLLGALALVVLAVGLVVGLSAHRDGERARAGGAEPTRVPATLLEDVGLPPAPYARPAINSARATWQTASGPRTGVITVRGAATAGTVRAIWIDRQGRPVPPPVTPAALLFKAVLGATAVVTMGWSALGALWLGVRGLLMWCNGRAWQREWAAVEPVWSGRPSA